MTDFISLTVLPNMTTELPYAADAEVSLSYDELEVREPLVLDPFTHRSIFRLYFRCYGHSIRRNRLRLT